MIRFLVFIAVLLLSGFHALPQSNFPLGTANRDGSRVTGVIGRNGVFPTYSDKVFWISQNGSVPSNSFKFPDYGIIHFAEGCGNKKYVDLYVIYRMDNTDRNSVVINPSQSSPAAVTLEVIAGTSRRMQCIGGGTTSTRETLSTISLKFEQPQWEGLEELKQICNGVDKNFNLTDYFSVKDDVTFNLDDINTPPLKILNPTLLSVGFHRLIASKTYDNGQFDNQWGSRPGVVQFTFEFEVLPSAQIKISSFPASICKNDAPFTISATPTGTWSGSAIDAMGNVTPSKAIAGRNELIYTVQNANGCVSEKTIEIQAKEPPTINVKDIDVCSTSEPFELNVGTPGGGTYIGRSIISNIFTPAKALTGANPVVYTYQDPTTLCSATGEFSINILTAESFRVGEDFTICTTSPELNLNLRDNVSPTDGTIVWSGVGVVNQKYFNPAAAGIGIHTITGTLYISATGCTYSKTLVTKVIEGPVVTAGKNLVFCKASGQKRLTDGLPTGGEWQGEYTSGGYFDTDQAPVGNYIIKYTYTDGICIASDTKIISVVALPVVFPGNDFTLCAKDNIIKLPEPSPSGGVWTSDGPYLISPDQVDPSKMRIGNNKLTYSVFDGTCPNHADLNINVLLPPDVDAGANLTVCANQGPINLDPKPKNGKWVGAGITANSIFEPSIAGIGDHLLSYTYQDPTTKCSNTATILARVLPIPTIYAGPDLVLCKNAGDVLLTKATPLGGIFQGDFVSAGYFRTSLAPAGIYTIEYRFSNGNCESVAHRIIQVIDVDPVFAGNDFSVCANDKAISLPIPKPGGGVYTTLAGDFYDTASNMVVPSKMQNGLNYLVYTIQDQNNCVTRDTLAITLNQLPKITGMKDFEVCIDASPVLLQAKPDLGIWQGPGVENNQFSPQNGVTENLITYTWVDPITTCVAVDTVMGIVNQLPVISVQNDTSICIASGKLLLMSGPLGGTWSGTGVSGSYIDPVIPGAGITKPIYTYQDPTTHCTASKSSEITIYPVPGKITITGDTTACIGDVVILTAKAENAKNFAWYRDGEVDPFAEGTTIKLKILKDEKIKIKTKAVTNGECTGEDRILQLLSDTPDGAINYTGNNILDFGALFKATADLKNTVKYEWNFGDNGTSYQKEANHYYYQSGKYNVSLLATSPLGCSNRFTLPDSITIRTENGMIPEPETDRGNGIDLTKGRIKVYPTVARDRITIEFTANANQEVELIFFDQSGNHIRSIKKDAISGRNKFLINLSFINPLYYFLQIKSNDYNQTFKLQKL